MSHDPHIPGQTPIDDLSGLKVRGIDSQAQLNTLEALNIRRATLRYLAMKPSRRLAPFDVAWAKRLHAEMFGDVWEWAGKFRTRDLNLGSPVHSIAPDVFNLLEDLREWQQSRMPLLEQSVRLHHRAVQIHPFQNGNGRWSRMLANIWLRLNDSPLVEWPEAVIGITSPARSDYLDAVRAADRHNLGPLISLHARWMSASS